MQKRDFLLALLVTMIWGSNFSVIKLGLRDLDPFLLTTFRFLFLAIPLCFFIKKPEVKMKYVAAYGFIFGVGIWGIANVAMYIGLPAGVASLLMQLSAFFTIVLSAIYFKERLVSVQYIGMALIILGLIAILYFTQNEFTILGGVLAILGGFSWSICNIIIKKCQPQQMIPFIIWSSLFSAIPLLIITYLVKGSAPFMNLRSSLSPMAIFSIFFQTYITTLFGYWVWNRLMKKYIATTVAPISLLVPIFGILTSHIIFHEAVSTAKLLSASLIIVGIVILVYGQKIRRKLIRDVKL